MLSALTRVVVSLLAVFALGFGPQAVARPRRMGRSLRGPGYREPGSLITSIPAYKFNTILGMTVCHGSALAIGYQFGYAPFSEKPFYVGPEINFSLFSPGSILGTLGSAWYEWRLTRDQKLSLVAGVVAGAGFSTQLQNLSTVTTMFFLDTALSQEMDDLFSIRGQVRPGLIGKSLALMTSFSISFRFY